MRPQLPDLGSQLPHLGVQGVVASLEVLSLAAQLGEQVLGGLVQRLEANQFGGAGLSVLPGGLQIGAQTLGLLVVALAHFLQVSVGGQGLLARCSGLSGGGGQLQRQGCGPVAVLAQLGA
ncbi:hypothetical protein AB0F88_42950 [Streptosporangium sp. NPDC023963]|uniref:hypothetical protein n=1 Tax=Streptosporangium sp. NPDC023963 TaxID=3155608 RepID=UPI003445C77C